MASASHPDRPTILLVDDEPLMRWSITESLGDCGYDIVEAGDAAGSSAALTGSRPDLVILDLRGLDNDLQPLAAVRRRFPHAPVIVMTAFGTPELVGNARRLGAFAVLGKPFEMGALQPLVRRALAASAN
jgi:DNA-binding NtrC family response regulator